MKKFVKFVCDVYQDRDEFADMMSDGHAHDSWPDEQSDQNVETREFDTLEEASEWGKLRTRDLNFNDESFATYNYSVVGVGPRGRRTKQHTF